MSESNEENDQIKTQSEPDDILGNKSILKQTIIPGIPDTRPARTTLATVSYDLFSVDNSTSETRLIESVKNESFIVGEYDILPAIDMSIQLMDRGEHATIDSDVRHCYGETGCEEKQLTPVTTTNSYRMKIDLQLHDWKGPVDISTLSVNERLAWGEKKRQRGNFSYRRKEYATALQCYQNALKFLDANENPLSENQEAEATRLVDGYIQVQNNLAQVHLLNNQYEQCLTAVDRVLQFDRNNIKALFRQAKALVELGNYEHAVGPLKVLLQNSDPGVERAKVKEMLNLCETKLAKYQKDEKEIYRRMFQSKNSSPIQTNSKIDIKPNQNWRTYAAIGGTLLLGLIGIGMMIKYH